MTPFGKDMRHLRIDRGMLLGDMAEVLQVSSAYLSQIENGKRPIPSDFEERVIALFNLSGNEAEQIRMHALEAKTTFTLRLGRVLQIRTGRLFKTLQRYSHV